MLPAKYADIYPELSVLGRGINSGFGDVRTHYGAENTSRLDVFERVDRTTACVYDIKTAKRNLSFARAEEFIGRVSYFPGVNTVIVVQVGVTWLASSR